MLTSPSGKSYIGITSFALEKRWSEHVRDALSNRRGILFSAIRKYGADNFTLKIISVENDWKVLCDLEKQAIRKYNTCGRGGYNATSGGDGVPMLLKSTKERHRLNTSIGTRLAWLNGKMRNRAAVFSDPEFKKKHAAATSAGTLKAFQNPEKRKRQLDAIRRPEVRSAVSEKIKLLWQDPDYRKRQVELRRGRSPRTAESKLIQGLRMKKLIEERKANGTYWADSIRKARKDYAAKSRLAGVCGPPDTMW